jgi:hypothetical protein
VPRSSAQLRTSLVTLFLSRFTLSPAEEAVLNASALDLDHRLFETLDRVEAIRRDSRALLGGDEAQAGYV